MPVLDKRSTMKLYKKCEYQQSNINPLGFRLQYICSSDADRAAFKDRMEEVAKQCPPLDRKTLAVLCMDGANGTPAYPNDRHLKVEVGFQSTASMGLSGQNFTGADLLKIAGAFDAAGVIDFNVKQVLQGLASSMAAPSRGKGKP